jgi:aryl-phospho-beta-D-glucosidase BglC (GH1 family)
VAPLDEEDLDLIARSGFNVIRLPIAWSGLEPRLGRIDTQYLDAIAATVERINSHGLYVVLDLHVTLSWSPRFGGAGAPAWATIPLVPDVRCDKAGDWTDAASPAVLASNAYFWLSPDWQADVGLVWRAVAARFRNVSGVAGYDMYNEPNSAPLPPDTF